MTPDADARLAEIRARSEAALPFDLATHAFQDVPWLLDRLAAETERADKAEARFQRQCFDECELAKWDPDKRNTFGLQECMEHEVAVRRELAELRARIEAALPLALMQIGVNRHGMECPHRKAVYDELRCTCEVMDRRRRGVQRVILAALSPAEEPN